MIERAALENDGETITKFAIEFQSTSVAPVVPRLELSGNGDEPQSLTGIERAHIVTVLRQCHFKVSGPKGAAAVLGMHPNTLRYRMQKLGITRDEC